MGVFIGINKEVRRAYGFDEIALAPGDFTVNPDEVDRNRALADEIYATINFMDDAKKILHQLLNQKEYQTPKDVKILVEAFRMADDRTTQLRLIRENVKGDGYYGEDQ